jgi:hypothetical protein
VRTAFIASLIVALLFGPLRPLSRRHGVARLPSITLPRTARRIQSHRHPVPSHVVTVAVRRRARADSDEICCPSLPGDRARNVLFRVPTAVGRPRARSMTRYRFNSEPKPLLHQVRSRFWAVRLAFLTPWATIWLRPSYCPIGPPLHC